MKGMMYINNQDAYEVYGLIINKGVDRELLKPPKSKPGFSYDWGDENGIETDPDEPPVFERKTYNLPMTLMADNYSDFATKYTEFVNFLLTAKEFNLDISHLNRRFIVRYQSVTSFDKLTPFHSGGKIGCALWLQLTDDYPTEIFLIGVPNPPTLLDIVLNGSGIPVLSWVEGNMNGSPKTGNRIQRRVLGGQWSNLVDVEGVTTFTDGFAEEGISYEYRVATSNAVGWSNWSNVQFISRTLPQRGTVTNITYSSTYGNGQNFGYKQYVPGDYETNLLDYPLVIWLHGLGERSTGNGNPQFSRLELYGPFKEVKDNNRDYPFLMIAPQQPTDVTGQYAGRTTWDEEVIEESLQHFKNQGYRIDLNKVYITGQSMGGGGVFNYLSVYGETIAAALPIASTMPKGFGIACLTGVKNTPIWAFHADGDPQVPSSNTKDIVTAINSCSPAPAVAPKITIFNLSSHTGWNQVYGEGGAPLTSYPNNTPYPHNGENWWQWLLKYQLAGSATAPGQVTGVNANSVSDEQINVTWNTPPSGGSPITGYRIERRVGAGAWSILVSNTGNTSTIYYDGGLMAGTTYYYRVSAINAVGVGAASNTASATTATAATVPSAPTGIIATVISYNSIEVSWITPANGGSPITGYKIDRRIGSGSWSTLVENTASESTSYIDTGLDPETTYRYRVSAINAVGVGAQSGEAVASTPVMPDLQNSFKINFGGSVGSAYPEPELEGVGSEWHTIWHDVTREGAKSFILKNIEGMNSSLVLYAQNPGGSLGWGILAGNCTGDAGTVTGNNSGIVPDNVSKFYWFTNKNTYANGAELIIDGFEPNSKWNIRFLASRATSDSRQASFKIDGLTKSVFVGNNTDTWVEFNNIDVGANGELSILISAADGFQYGYLNAMTLEKVEEGELYAPNVLATTNGPNNNKITVN